MKKGFYLRILFFLLITILILSGCQDKNHMEHEDSNNHSQIKVQQENRSNQSSLNRSVTPLSVDMNTFQFIIGWLNEYEILIYDFFDQQAHLSSYHVLTGETDEFLSIDDRIITAQLSPSRNYLFIHTSRSPYEAQLDIYDTQTKEKVSGTTIESREIHYTWNPHNEKKILITAFYEDWTYTMYIFDFNQETLTPIEVPQPFATWCGESDLLILNWNVNEPDLTAPLVKISGGEQKPVLDGEEFFHFDGTKNVFLGLKAEKESPVMGEMTVYNTELKKLFSSPINLLANYSGWVTPFYELINENLLFIIEPKSSGIADNYQEGFQFVKWNLPAGEKEVVVELEDYGPVDCSPKGEICLVGYQKEKIVNLIEKKIEPFLIFSEEN